MPKSQNMKLQKRHLEVSNSTRGKDRAFFRFAAKRKNLEIFQMSQKKRLEILHCAMVLKVFSKKRGVSV
jgi:muconolactone delta-isomerase